MFWEEVASNTHGFVGADLAQLCTEAALTPPDCTSFGFRLQASCFRPSERSFRILAKKAGRFEAAEVHPGEDGSHRFGGRDHRRRDPGLDGRVPGLLGEKVILFLLFFEAAVLGQHLS